MINTASRLLLPFFLMSIFTSAACSSSGGASPGSDGGTHAVGECPAHCTYDSSRDATCTSSSKVGERYACACDDGLATGFQEGLDCGTDLGLVGSGKNGLCCNPKPSRQPAGASCDTAQDCEEVTCTCGQSQGGTGSACVNGVCAGAKAVCGC